MMALRKLKWSFEGDKAIWTILFLMSILSLAAVYSSTGDLAFTKMGGNTEFFLYRRFIILAIGWVAAYITHKISIRYIKIIAVATLVLIIPMLIINLIVGSRWAEIPVINISFQFSEVAKIALLVYTSWQLAYHKDKLDEYSTFLKLIIPVVIVSGLIFLGDFSTAALIFFTNFVLIFMGRAKLRHIFALTLIMVIFGTSLYQLIKTYPEFGRFSTWNNRIESFLSEDESINDGNYQITQSKIAIAGGGLLGKLPGKSTQRYFLPEAHNDFIYAIIIEEYGSLIATGLMFLYLILLYRSIRIFLRSERTFNRLVVLGIGFTISFQAMINMGVSVGLFPVTGQTLPAISQGGTSVLITFIAIGIIQAITAGQNRNSENETQEDYE
ncbi:MAG: FtsW/RodA/SpoVE family cell cycle protein [Bacteroidales bacterium]|nr:FtsW/RodA/SpoVE family cell cycle protein [Bacteroidales bacterium]MCF8333292.1 FtsW/RodA/SpoVE family cell cycle protein [Bacteroidales bacterium]